MSSINFSDETSLFTELFTVNHDTTSFRSPTISNNKKKGKGNVKSGNKYLAWAFSEVAEIARRSYPEARAYYNRKMQKTNFMVAHNALSHKPAKAAYYIMKDGVSFMPEKIFV